MPGTLNGVGTHYYGKRDRKSEMGVCSHCGKTVQLQSYETTLWFVVFFIPIIPLGRKRVIDFCPKCTRHHVMEVKKWEKLRHETLEKHMQEMRDKPNDPDAAIRMHDALETFGQREEAHQLAAFIKERFADNATVQMHLGASYQRRGHTDAAQACFETALALDPASRAARLAVGLDCVTKGELNRAREILGFMAEDGSHRNAAALLALASAHRRRGDYASAMDVCQDALAWLPDDTSQDKAFRREVRLNERALGSAETVLPKSKRRTRLIAAGASILALLVLGALLANLIFARTQTLNIVNALPVPATVEIAGHDPVRLRMNDHLRVRVGEGDHAAIITIEGQSPRSTAFTLSNSLKQRFRRKNLFVLNVGGAAVFLWQKMQYRQSPNPNETYPYKLFFNQEFLEFHDIDYPFQAPPDTIRRENSSSLWRTHVEMLHYSPIELLNLMIQEGLAPDQILQFAETHLETSPHDGDLLRTYIQILSLNDRVARGLAFLKKGLHHRPVIVDWHRYYQTFASSEEMQEELTAEYDELLQAQPNDASLLYLRGRICKSAKESFSFYDRAIIADPDNPYPKSAKAFHLAGIGRLDEALALSQAACAHKSATVEMTGLLYTIRKLSGDHAALAAEAAAELRKSPTDIAALQRLMENTIPQGNVESAEQAMDAFFKASGREVPSDSLKELKASLQLQFDYLSGDIDAYVEDIESVSDETTKRIVVYVGHVTKLEMPEADASYVQEWDSTGYWPLLHALGWLARGNAESAAPWLAKAADALEKASGEERIVAQMLRKHGGPALEKLDDLVIYPANKRILYTVFAALNEAERERLLSRADALSVDRSQPHLFLARVTDELRKTDKTRTEE